MRFIISSSQATNDPTQVSLAWMAAKAAIEQGHQVILWLQNEAVSTARADLQDFRGVGLPETILESRKKAAEAGVEVWLCKACAIVRGITDEPKVAPEIKSVSWKGVADFVKAVSEADRYLAF